MENKFLRNPIKCVVTSAGRPHRTYVFVGDVPKKVAAAVESGRDKAVLQDWYGPGWAKKLAAADISGGGSRCEGCGGCEICGGCAECGGLSKYTGGCHECDPEGARAGRGPLSENRSGGADAPSDYSSPISKNIDLSDIESMLAEKTQPKQRAQLSRGVEHVFGVHIFPEDKLSEVRDKIHLVSGIPPYRQHLYYVDGGRAVTTYNLTADGLVDTDIRELHSSTAAAHVMFGIPVDKSLYELREVARVEALDSFVLVGDLWRGGADRHGGVPENAPADTVPMTMFVVDLAEHTGKIRSQLAEASRDRYRFELFYNGFILKYWPQLTLECFRDYILSEDEFEAKYPEMAKNKSQLSAQFRAEREIITRGYALADKRTPDEVTFAVLEAMATVPNPRVLMNIRNLFDKLRASKCVPEIQAHVENAGRRYLLRKCHRSNGSDIPFPSAAVLKAGICIAISLRKEDQDNFHTKTAASTSGNEFSRYMFLNIMPSGRVNVKMTWNEEDEVDFALMLKRAQTFANPIIEQINQMGRVVFSAGTSLSLISKHNIDYSSLTVCVLWKRVMISPSFKLAKAYWDNYMRAGIVGPRNVQQLDKFEFVFKKGVHEFDSQLIERIVTASNNITLMNQYAHLSVEVIRQKWQQNYSGRVVRMLHRTADVRFEIVDAREGEFDKFRAYIEAYVKIINADQTFTESFSRVRDYADVKKLKKLREQDPELFNMKKHGARRGYSELCQSPRQPLLYTDDEIRGMNAAEIRRLTKYWNFTLERPTYYGCPSKKFPHLHFLVGKHPRGYCLPCCNAKNVDEIGESRRAGITAKCLRDRVYTADGADAPKHIMAYGKEIDVGRLAKIPPAMKSLLFGTLQRVGGTSATEDTAAARGPKSEDYYLYGVHQMLPEGYFGFAFAVADALSTTLPALVKELSAGISSGGLYYTLYGGALGEFFGDERAFLAKFSHVFSGTTAASVAARRFTKWAELFVEAVGVVMGVGVLTFIDEDGGGENIDLFAVNGAFSAEKFVILVRRLNRYYPVFVLNSATYFKTFVARRTFARTDPAVQIIMHMVKNEEASFVTVRAEQPPDYNLIFAAHSSGAVTIRGKLVGKHNKVYGVILGAGSKGGAAAMSDDVYFPCVYSPVQANGEAPGSIKLAKYPERAGSARDVAAAILAINAAATGTKYAKIFPQELLMQGGRAYGFSAGWGNFYFDPTVVGDTHADKDLPHEWLSIPRRDTIYDFMQVNREILAPTVKETRVDRAPAALYDNYIYQLYLVEFVGWLGKFRDTEMRKKILAAVRSKEARREMRDALDGFPADIATVQGQLNQYFKSRDMATFTQQITETTYDFDKVRFNELRALPRDDLVRKLEAISREFVVEQKEVEIGEFPNVYFPCADSGADYCVGKKLAVRSVTPLAELLAADIKNDLKSRYLVDSVYMDIVVDFLKFTQVPTETVTVYKL